MPSVLEQLVPTGESLTAARGEYAELIARGHAPNAGDVERLRELMVLLNLTNDQVAAHLEARQTARGYKSEIAALMPTAESLADEARRMNTLDAEVKALRKALDETTMALRQLHGAQVGRQQTRGQLTAEVERLKSDHPLAFGVEPAQPQARRTSFGWNSNEALTPQAKEGMASLL